VVAAVTAWLNGGKALALDLESTGTDVHTDRIVTACAAIVADGQAAYERQWLVAVDIDIPAEASAVHGISTEHAREHGVPAAEAIPEIATAVRYAVHSRMPIIAFNAAFDLSMLNAECIRHGLGTLEEFCGRPIAPVIDPLCIDKHVDRFRKGSRKLTDTCELLGVVLEDAHTAAADAIAAAEVARRLAERCDLDAAALRALYTDRRYPSELAQAFRALGRMTVDQLHAAQVQWYREQSEGLGDYWRKKAHEAALRAASAAERMASTDNPAVREAADQERIAAEMEVADLEAKIAGLSFEWPLRTYREQGANPS
jgi:DNA polymerase-3 subunit epsilon